MHTLSPTRFPTRRRLCAVVALATTFGSCTRTVELPRQAVLIRPDESSETLESLVGFTTKDGAYHEWRTAAANDFRPGAEEIGVVLLDLPELAGPRGLAVRGFTTTSDAHFRSTHARAFLVGPDSLLLRGSAAQDPIYGTYSVDDVETLTLQRADVGGTLALVGAAAVLASVIYVLVEPPIPRLPESFEYPDPEGLE